MAERSWKVMFFLLLKGKLEVYYAIVDTILIAQHGGGMRFHIVGKLFVSYLYWSIKLFTDVVRWYPYPYQANLLMIQLYKLASW